MKTLVLTETETPEVLQKFISKFVDISLIISENDEVISIAEDLKIETKKDFTKEEVDRVIVFEYKHDDIIEKLKFFKENNKQIFLLNVRGKECYTKVINKPDDISKVVKNYIEYERYGNVYQTDYNGLLDEIKNRLKKGKKISLVIMKDEKESLVVCALKKEIEKKMASGDIDKEAAYKEIMETKETLMDLTYELECLARAIERDNERLDD